MSAFSDGQSLKNVTNVWYAKNVGDVSSRCYANVYLITKLINQLTNN